jgi:hypothetical protein
VDQDCDGDTDEDATDAVVYYYDIDGDGFGNARFPLAACDVPDGYVANADDCDDTDGYAYPGATERCDDADNDCDGSVDEDLYVMQYADEDGDGFGDPALPEYACLGTYGLVGDATDCDDSDADVNTDATEVCDAIDNDCDGATDEGWLVRRYLDEDGDGYGDAATAMDVCPDEPDVVATAGDCDDADSTVSPAATETCDGVDEDCDGGTDEGLLGSGAACAAEDCLDVLTDRPSATNGSYWLYGSGSVVSAVCDMTGGGWTRVLADTMDTPDSGWSTRTTTNCGGTTMLGGYNVFGSGASVSNTVATAYTHTQVKVTLDYWFIDSWDGESGTLDLAGTRVWTQSRISPSGTQRCGRADSGWNEDTASVSQTVSHTASSIVVRASSTLDQTPNDESWGIDNVIVWVR